MKKIIVLILICCLGKDLIGQPPIKRAGPGNTVEDYNLWIIRSFRPPVFQDTTEANNAITLDSCGKLLFTYDGNKLWKRQCNPKVWVEIGSGGGGGSITDTIQKVMNYITIDSIGDFATFSGYTNSVSVRDTLRGGVFNIYNGTDTADNGMIFEDALGRKWKRVLTDKKINIRWYGARAYTLASPFDSRPAFLAAKNYIETRSGSVYDLYIPSDTSGLSAWSQAGSYYLSDSVLFNKSISIVGDGYHGKPITRLRFPLNKKGFLFKEVYGQEQMFVKLKDLSFIADTDIPNYNLNSHGITITCKFLIDNIECTDWGGYGLYITSCAAPPTGENNNYGNADGSRIIMYRSTFCTNGIFIEGCDANTFLVDELDIIQQRRWGVFDNGFLGNAYKKAHYAFCGSPAINGANSVVSYGGKYYTPIYGYDGYYGDSPDSIYNIVPTNATYWIEVDPQSAVVWNDSTRYYSGGTISIRNSNAWTSIESIYSESGQPGAQLNDRSKVDNDNDDAAGVLRGIHHYIFEGENIKSSAGVHILGQRNAAASLTVGAQGYDATAPLVITNDYDKTGSNLVAKFKTIGGSSSAAMMLESTTTKAILNAYGGNSLLLANVGATSSTLALNYTGLLYDADNNGVMSLGINGNAFGNFYAKTPAGAGTKAVRMNSATGQHFYTDTLIFSAGWGNLISGVYPNIIIGADSSLLATKLYVKHYADSVVAAGSINLGNSNLTQSTADALREYTLGYFNASGDRYLSFGKANYAENASILINANSTNHNGFIQMFAKDSTNGLQISETISPNGNRKYTTLSKSSLTTTISNYMDSIVIAYTGATKLRYNLGKDTFSIKGIMPISASSTDSVLVRGNDNVIKLRAQSDIATSGTYTPTLTNVANVAASTAYSCQYSRVGTVVTVSGEVDIDPTTTLTLTQLGISLPIASNLTATNELGGTSADDLGTAARVAGDATNNRAEVRMTPTDVTNRRFSFTFTYRIL